MNTTLDERFGPLLGESVWHTLTFDPTRQEVSELHFHAVQDILTRHGSRLPSAPQILEVAAYAHTTGYILNQRLGAQATLLDISASTLKLGRETAQQQGLPIETTRLVSADFHDLPFHDHQFHVVYICSALHHTWNWQQVLAELTRVLAPGGLLLLENEPCQREFCFYHFRTNRINNFTPFETKLDQLGIIRTVAEPYLGSRPETLFGMVENQIIPLDELKRAIEKGCELLEFSVTPEVCMGSLEQEMVKRRTMDVAGLAAWLSSKLGELLSQSAPAMGEVEKGLGFSLPNEKSVAALCSKVAGLLKALPSPPPTSLRQRLVALLFRLARVRRKLLRHLESLPLSAIRSGLARAMSVPAGLQNRAARAATASFSDDPYREGLARLFGANVKIVARKRGTPLAPPEGRLKAVYPEREGVVLGFEPYMLRLLSQCSAFSPDVQSSPEEAIHSVFPTDEWTIEISSPGEAIQGILPDDWIIKSTTKQIRSLVSCLDSGRVLLLLQSGSSLILLRCHGTYRDQPYRILLLQDGRELAHMDIFQSESFMLAGTAETNGTGLTTLLLKVVSMAGGDAPSDTHISLSYLGAVNY